MRAADELTPPIAILDGANDARLDVRLPLELKEELEADAAEIGLSGPAYAKLLFAIATGRVQGLARISRARRQLERQKTAP